jgi:hypothetical protein
MSVCLEVTACSQLQPAGMTSELPVLRCSKIREGIYIAMTLDRFFNSKFSGSTLKLSGKIENLEKDPE